MAFWLFKKKKKLRSWSKMKKTNTMFMPKLQQLLNFTIKHIEKIVTNGNQIVSTVA